MPNRQLFTILLVMLLGAVGCAQPDNEPTLLLQELKRLESAQPVLVLSDTGLRVKEPPSLEKRARELWKRYKGRSSSTLSLPGASVPLSSEEREALWRRMQDERDYHNDYCYNSFGPFLPRRPEVFDWVARSYKEEEQLPNWLVANDPRHRKELVRRASAGPCFSLKALMILDPDRAALLAKKVVDGASRLEALGLLLAHPASEPEARTELVALATNPMAVKYDRARAARLVLGYEWPGRDEFFLELLKDPLWAAESDFINPFDDFVLANPRWIPRLANLVADSEGAVRNNAVLALLTFGGTDARDDALRPLLPWLRNGDWATVDWRGLERGRLRLIRSLGEVELPGAIPGLLHILRESTDGDEILACAEILEKENLEQFPDLLRAALPRANSREVSLANMAVRVGVYKPEQQIQAAGALVEEVHRMGEKRRAADRASGWDLDSMEQYSLHNDGYSLGRFGRISDRLSPKQALGIEYFDRLEVPEFREGLLQLARDWHDEGNPALETLDMICFRLKGASADRYLLSRVADGDVSATFLSQALYRSDRLRDSSSELLVSQVEQGGPTAGVAAAILGDRTRANSILAEGTRSEQLALLASARYLCLPLELTSLESAATDPEIKGSVLAYLEVSEQAGAPELRARLHGGYQISGRKGENWNDAWETKLLEEYLRKGKSGDLYALHSHAHNVIARNETEVWLQGESGEIVLPHPYESKSYEHRILSAEEVRTLRAFAEERSIDSWSKWDTFGGATHWQEFRLLHLSPTQGRRLAITMRWHREQGKGQKYVDLIKLFASLAKVPTETVYPSLAHLPGARVVQEHSDAKRLWADEEGMKVDLAGKSGKPSWWFFTPEGLQGRAAPPKDRRRRDDGNPILPDGSRLIMGDEALRVANNPNDLVHRVLQKGCFGNPVFGPEGRILIGRVEGESWAQPNSLKLITLADGTLQDVDIPFADDLKGVAYLPYHKAFLARRVFSKEPYSYPYPSPQSCHWYLVDPKSGRSRRVSGELRPWSQSWKAYDQRPLQTAGDNRYWCALRTETGTEVGIIDEETFVFERKAHYPDLYFRSEQMWVLGDDVYVAMKDILRLPLTANASR